MKANQILMDATNEYQQPLRDSSEIGKEDDDNN